VTIWAACRFVARASGFPSLHKMVPADRAWRTDHYLYPGPDYYAWSGRVSRPTQMLEILRHAAGQDDLPITQPPGAAVAG
jgi:hypothetical protein